MDIRTTQAASPELDIAQASAIGKQELQNFTLILNQYKAGKTATEARIKESERWWKLRNSAVEAERTDGDVDEFHSKSGWLHNVITSKHADFNAAYPRPNIRPRERSDQPEAKRLSAIVPCVLKANGFRRTWSDNMWQKGKSGTGSYKVTWDTSKLNGLGDISINRVSLLSVYWQPGLSNIQKSPYFFHVEAWDKASLLQRYPQLDDRALSQDIMVSEFQLDDTVSNTDRIPVIEVYYHKRGVLHYCQYTGLQLIYATENDPECAETGLYDHGLYPYVMDPLFPIEGSPCGYGYVDVAKNPQLEIDALKTSFVKSARVGAEPCFLSANDGNVNEEEFADWRKRIKHVSGGIMDTTIKQLDFHPLDSVYVNVMDSTVQELRETTGNTESATGATPSGVTAASAIAALQEASGKGSQDAILQSYDAFEQVVTLVIELIRQFYNLPRQFRITGETGEDEFISYTNAGLQPQYQGEAYGMDQGYRLPVFDIEVSAEKANAYSRVGQNELAIQFFQMGFFNPQMADQALSCIQMMDFDGKDDLMQRIQQNAHLMQIAMKYLTLVSQIAPPEVQLMVQKDFMMLTGEQMPTAAPAPKGLDGGERRTEDARVERARAHANNAASPEGGPL